MDTIALDLEDRRRAAFAALDLRVHRLLVDDSIPENYKFITDSDLLNIAESWTVSDMDADCVQDEDGTCATHADYHLLTFMLEAKFRAMFGGAE